MLRDRIHTIAAKNAPQSEERKNTHNSDDAQSFSSMSARELDALLSTGQLLAEDVLIGAGFLGGASMLSICIFFALFAVCVGYFIYVSLALSGLQGNIPIFVLCLTVAATALLRVFFLVRKMYRRAYLSLLIMGPLVVLADFANIVSNFVLYVTNSENSKIYFCYDSTAAYCAERIQSIQVMYGLFNSATAIASSIALFGLFELAEGRRMSSSRAIQMAAFTAAMAFLFDSAAFGLGLSFGSCTFFFLFSLTLFWVYYYLLWRRQNVKNAADKIIEADMQGYNSSWDAIKTTANHEASDRTLTAAVESCLTIEPSGDAVSRKELLLKIKNMANIKKPLQLVNDLSVLYWQAKKMNAYFQTAVSNWSSGIMGAKAACIGVKRHQRAIEKLFRSYTGNANRLIDLVRSSITFSDLDSMTDGIIKIRDDPRVVILQIKNRFAFEYDSRESAGYRNVCLSIIIVDDFTVEMGMDTHICELQLGLESFEIKKHAAGHARYVKWRNILAE